MPEIKWMPEPQEIHALLRWAMNQFESIAAGLDGDSDEYVMCLDAVDELSPILDRIEGRERKKK